MPACCAGGQTPLGWEVTPGVGAGNSAAALCAGSPDPTSSIPEIPCGSREGFGYAEKSAFLTSLPLHSSLLHKEYFVRVLVVTKNYLMLGKPCILKIKKLSQSCLLHPAMRKVK